jgi:NAD-dependent DNA ligase
MKNENERPANIRQPTQFHRRYRSATRRQHHRRTPHGFFPLLPAAKRPHYFDHHSKTLAALEAAGFKVNPNHKLVRSMDEVWAFIQQWEARRDSLPYEIDGIVVKGRPHCLAGRARLHRQSPALGHRL